MANKNRVPIPGSERFTRAGSRVTGAPDPHESLEVSVLLRPRKPLDDLASRKELGLSTPGERKYLTREEFAATYGADPKDVAKIEAFAHDHNLTVGEVSLPRRTVVLSGTTASLSAAFGVYLANYEHPEGTFRGRTGPIFIPADLDGVVEGVFGFDNRPQARPHFRHPKVTEATSRAGSPSAYTPVQVAQLYNFPSGVNGSGECIGILEFGGGYNSTELNHYFEQLGITPPQVTAVSVDGAHNKPQPGQNSPDVEVALDIEVAGSVAPGASIAVYFSNFTERGWVDAITSAVHDSLHKPSVLSVSWGFAEGKLIWSRQAIRVVNEALQAAAAMGVTVCVASGDDGSRDQVNDGHAHVDFPASSAFVLACGGTRLESSNGQITRESVWNDGVGGGAGGGGISVDVALPSWQTHAHVPPSVNPGHHVGRGVPDVAGNADPQTGYQIFADGQAQVVGGTSAVAPLWAGLIACLNQRLGTPVGFLNPLLYSQVQQAGALHDITAGNNDITGHIGGYSAAAGWDACTGYGTPDGSAIATTLTGTAAAAGGSGDPGARRPRAGK